MTVTHETWDYRDGYGVPIAAQAWVPEDPRATLQVLHGIGEHSGRYDRFARALAARGFAVFAEDHRGHGKTSLLQHDGDESKFGLLGKGGLRAAEAAIAQLTAQVRERFPKLPMGVFAHSWGSLMAQRMIQREAYWDAAVFSGTAYRTVRYMESRDLNAKFPGPTGHEWLSRDENIAQLYVDDPLTYESNIRKQLSFADTLRLLGVPRRGVASEVPILIVGGGDDALNIGDGRDRLAAAYRSVGVRDVTIKVYPEARHEVINELNAEEAIAYIIEWFESRLLS